MRIAAKLNIGILAVFTASVLANYCVFQVTIKPQFDAIEIATSKMNHKRVLDALGSLQVKLRNSAQDWGFWDDTYDFALGNRVETYVKSNLGAPATVLDGLGIELLIFVDSKGSVLWGEAIDPSTNEEIPALVEDVRRLDFKHPLLSGAGEAKAASGLIKTSKGLVLIASAPILKTDRSGEPAGMIWMGYRLDEAAVVDLTGVTFRLEEPAASSPTISKEVGTNSLDNAVVTTSLITDINDRPLVVLRAETPRDVGVAGATAVNSAVWLTMLAGLVLMFALWFLVNRVVVSRVVALKDHFATAGENGQLRHTQQVHANDEIGQLAKAFDEMAGQVNHLRDVVADSSYLSGMAEWAAGTLHNVRNGLSPINGAAWRAQSLFETPWMTNVKSALAQLKSPDTPAEKREKLAAYVLSKCPQILERAEQVNLTSQEIMSASRAVEDMVSGYEKFSRHEITLEPIDLLPFVETVATAAVTSQAPDVQLTLPSATTTVMGNRTLLRQILTNILANSFEAMEGLSRAKQIRFEWHVDGDSSGNLRLTVADNGEGILPDNLESVFERGFSTRQHKVGGLGLHWCANAAKKLGGSLKAESDGPGTGARFVLCLPTSPAKPDTLKEAA